MAEDQSKTTDEMAERVKATLAGQPPKQDSDQRTAAEQQKPDNQASSTRSGVGSGQTNHSVNPTVGTPSSRPPVSTGTGETSGATNPTVAVAQGAGKASAEVNAQVGIIKQKTASGEVVGLEQLGRQVVNEMPRPVLSAPAFRAADAQNRIKAIDKTLKASEDEDARIRTSDIALMRAQRDELERHEATRVSGAPILMPRSRLLDASYAKDKNPDFNYRWVNITDGGRVGARRADGWERVPEDEGGMQLGEEMALFRIPKEQHARLRSGLRARQEASFSEPKKQFEASLDDVARMLREKHGIRLSDRQIRERINNSDE